MPPNIPLQHTFANAKTLLPEFEWRRPDAGQYDQCTKVLPQLRADSGRLPKYERLFNRVKYSTVHACKNDYSRRKKREEREDDKEYLINF